MCIHEKHEVCPNCDTNVALNDAVVQSLYRSWAQKGFKSSYSDYKDLLKYHKMLEDLAIPSLSSAPIPSHRNRTIGSEQEYSGRILGNVEARLDDFRPPQPALPSVEDILQRRRTNIKATGKSSLPSTLSMEEEQQVYAILGIRGVVSKCAGEQVSDNDISRLRPGHWINDEIVNFYGGLILAHSRNKEETTAPEDQKCSKKEISLNIHYFSSFFWSKLINEGYDKGKMSRWTKAIDIFSKDVILLPINYKNAHWTAAAINFRQKRFESYDSMNMAKSEVFRVLRLYVHAEHINKRNKPFDFQDWKDWAPAATPQQENSYDCGIFTCQFLEIASRGQDFFNFTQDDILYLQKRMILEIGNAKLHASW